jgi:hypothetical protein
MVDDYDTLPRPATAIHVSENIVKNQRVHAERRLADWISAELERARNEISTI